MALLWGCMAATLNDCWPEKNVHCRGEVIRRAIEKLSNKLQSAWSMHQGSRSQDSSIPHTHKQCRKRWIMHSALSNSTPVIIQLQHARNCLQFSLINRDKEGQATVCRGHMQDVRFAWRPPWQSIDGHGDGLAPGGRQAQLMLTQHDYHGFVGSPANPFTHTATMTAQRVNPNTITLPQTFGEFLQGQATRTLRVNSIESLCITPKFTSKLPAAQRRCISR